MNLHLSPFLCPSSANGPTIQHKSHSANHSCHLLPHHPISLCPPLPGADLHHLSWSYYGLLTTPVTPSQPILHQEPKGIFPKCKVTPLTIKPFYSFLLLLLITKTSHSSRVPPRPGPRPPHQTQPHLLTLFPLLCPAARLPFCSSSALIYCSATGPLHICSSWFPSTHL